jgi:hypothetical protein
MSDPRATRVKQAATTDSAFPPGDGAPGLASSNDR